MEFVLLEIPVTPYPTAMTLVYVPPIKIVHNKDKPATNTNANKAEVNPVIRKNWEMPAMLKISVCKD
jgi:hypothetical protein